MAMHFDPNGAIAKSSGKMAGPIAEIKVSTCTLNISITYIQTILVYWHLISI